MEVVKLNAGAAATVSPMVAVEVSAVAVPESVILKVRLAVPTLAATGVPEITPAALMLMPVGSVPLVNVKV